MSKDLSLLIQRANLEIIRFGHDVRYEMNQMGLKAPYYIMSYLKQGEACVRIDRREIDTYAGSIVLLRSGELHDHIKKTNDLSEFLWWHFNFTISQKIDVLRLFRLPLLVQIENTESFEKIFLDYLNAIKQEKSIPDIIYRNARALDVFACLLENFLSAVESEIAPVIHSAFFQILEKVTGKPDAGLSLNTLSEQFHLNPTYISNKFHQHFGLSPITLHRQIILEAAKEQLLCSSINISEIAGDLGFSGLSAFTRFFTSKTGVSPTHYRNNAPM